MGIEMYLEQLKAVEERFYGYRLRMAEIEGQVRRQVARTVISKGPIFEPSPYYWQRLGVKLGKVIQAPVESDWCYRNHFDEQGRLILVEEYSAFLGCFTLTEIHLYGDTHQMLWFSASGLAVLREFSEDRMLAFAGSNGYIVEQVHREAGVPVEVRIWRSIVDGEEIHRFHYDGKALALIERICGNGYREVLYTTKKPDFAAIRGTVDAALRESIGRQGDFACLGIEGFLDQMQPMLCLRFAKEESPPELIADWGGEMIPVPVNEWMFSEAQLKKCVKLVAEILVELHREGLLAGKGIRFHQNQVCVCREFAGARKVLRDAGLTVS